MAPDPGRLLLGDGERERLAEALGRHYVESRLDADALDVRLEAVYGATYADEGAAALDGLPAAPANPSLAVAPRPATPRRSWWRGRHGEATTAQPGWRPTTERFVDPKDQRVMRVWVDPADGARHYIAE